MSSVRRVATPLPQSVDEAFADVRLRFLSLPYSELSDSNRLMFHLQVAFWYLVDELLPKSSLSVEVHFREFCSYMIDNTAVLRRNMRFVENYFDLHDDYSKSIPRFGTILVSSDYSHVLMVMSTGSASFGHFNFPKGKVNESESGVECAARETLEETGFDCLEYLSEDTFLVVNKTCLFVGFDVPRHKDSEYIPQTKGEITMVKWIKLSGINNGIVREGKKQFYLVRHALWLPKLLKMISERKSKKKAVKSKQSAKNLQNVQPVDTLSSSQMSLLPEFSDFNPKAPIPELSPTFPVRNPFSVNVKDIMKVM